MSHHEILMQAAIDEALIAMSEGEVPVGAVIYREGEIIAKAHNRRVQEKLATAHAEVIAIDSACRALADWRLDKCVLYVTAEPCFMCAGAILQARIPEVVYGVKEPKFGAVESNANVFDIASLNHHPAYTGGVREADIAQMMKDFFRKLRNTKDA